MRDETRSCYNCLLQKKEECFGKSKICEDYKPIPRINKEKMDNWPKYGDATFFRMTSGRKSK